MILPGQNYLDGSHGCVPQVSAPRLQTQYPPHSRLAEYVQEHSRGNSLTYPPTYPPGQLRQQCHRQGAREICYEVSAGGLCVRVEDGTPYVAVIVRRSKGGYFEWCLPKGHLEHRETPAEAALREVREETGIQGKIICHVDTVDYWFSCRESRIHKKVHHYLMEYVSGSLTVENDPDSEAEEAQWIDLRRVDSMLAYPNERKVVRTACGLLYPDQVKR